MRKRCRSVINGLTYNLDSSELGDGLGAFGHGVLGQLSGQDQANCSLDLARGDRGLLVIEGKSRGLCCHLKVINEEESDI